MTPVADEVRVGGLSRARLSGCRSSRRSGRAASASPSSSTERRGGRCPAAAVVEAGLAVGLELDRARARELARALRRHRARDTARPGARPARAFARLARARVSSERASARPTAGDVLDERDASGAPRRRAALPSRVHARSSTGAPAIFSCSTTSLATGSTSRRHERRCRASSREAVRADADRVGTRVERRARCRYLASRGFSEESLESLVADLESGAVG